MRSDRIAGSFVTYSGIKRVPKSREQRAILVPRMHLGKVGFLEFSGPRILFKVREILLVPIPGYRASEPIFRPRRYFFFFFSCVFIL